MLIKSIKFNRLQALDRVVHYSEWITSLFILAFILLALLKLLKPSKFYGFAVAFFTPGFFHKQAEENNSFFSAFQLIFFGFMCLIISLFTFLLLPEYLITKDFKTFLIILIVISAYLLIRFSLDMLISGILGLHVFLRHFIFSKLGYLKTLSVWLFPALIINEFTFKSSLFLIIYFFALVTFRFFLILYNNKRLMLNKLFYFILYLCALEIAPLLILYKITTK